MVDSEAGMEDLQHIDNYGGGVCFHVSLQMRLQMQVSQFHVDEHLASPRLASYLRLSGTRGWSVVFGSVSALEIAMQEELQQQQQQQLRRPARRMYVL